MANLHEIVAFLDSTLSASAFKDYCPNGLQVEGRGEVCRIVSGVTASRSLIEAAIAADADALLVHHGFFWKGEDPCVVGMKKKRLELLLRHDISLLVYHLPLDVHPVLGNNVQLAQRLGVEIRGGLDPADPRSVGNWGVLAPPLSSQQLIERLRQVCQRDVLHIAGGPESIVRVGFCTGAAQGYIEKAVSLGLDAYISGEISEPTVHVAKECGIHYFACGHHASETFGVQALGQYLAEQFGLEHQFIDQPVPV